MALPSMSAAVTFKPQRNWGANFAGIVIALHAINGMSKLPLSYYATPMKKSPNSPPTAALKRADNARLLAEIAAFCHRVGMAESTFGRRAVNDGKLVARLRLGGRIAAEKAKRVRRYIAVRRP